MRYMPDGRDRRKYEYDAKYAGQRGENKTRIHHTSSNTLPQKAIFGRLVLRSQSTIFRRE
jgi:hypothetical protein